MIDKDLTKILACPKCESDVEITEDKIICQICKKYYPIKNDVPIMLINEAKDI